MKRETAMGTREMTKQATELCKKKRGGVKRAVLTVNEENRLRTARRKVFSPLERRGNAWEPSHEWQEEAAMGR